MQFDRRALVHQLAVRMLGDLALDQLVTLDEVLQLGEGVAPLFGELLTIQAECFDRGLAALIAVHRPKVFLIEFEEHAGSSTAGWMRAAVPS